MKVYKPVIFFIFSTLILIFAILKIASPDNIFAQSNVKSRSIGVTASITPIGNIQLFGYTGPNSEVFAEGPRAYAQTLSDKEGYFIFQYIYIASETKELCIYSVDHQKRTSFPVCIPVTNINQTIGPVLLSPTISIKDKTSLNQNQAEASGQTIPESTVKIVLSKDTFISWNPIPGVYALFLPKYSVKSDQNGNYSFNIPKDSNGKYRLFTIADSPEGYTPKSQTLSLLFGSPFALIYLLIGILLFIIALIFLLRLIICGKKDRHGNRYLHFEKLFFR